jgi:anion-transporting  ArsA/GET3 family ATPase
MARQGAAVDHLLRDPTSTSVVAVAIPEQMAVSETLGLRAALHQELGIQLNAVVANRVFSPRFSARDAAALASAPDDPAVRSARWLDARTRAHQAHLARLREGLDEVTCTTLPFVFKGDLHRGDIKHLARLLGASLL